MDAGIETRRLDTRAGTLMTLLASVFGGTLVALMLFADTGGVDRPAPPMTSSTETGIVTVRPDAGPGQGLLAPPPTRIGAPAVPADAGADRDGRDRARGRGRSEGSEGRPGGASASVGDIGVTVDEDASTTVAVGEVEVGVDPDAILP
jgi:hypothetical protein